MGKPLDKISIALCITELDVGGAERCLVELATRLDRNRFEPVVYALSPPPIGDTSCLSALEDAGIEVRFLGFRRKAQLPAAVIRLASLLKQQKPRIIQSFLFHANMVARLAGHLASVPMVVSGIRVAERRGTWRLWVDRMTDRLVDRHICVSHGVARFSETQGRLPVNKLVVIPNGIDPHHYPTPTAADLTDEGIAPERRLVTYIGRLTPQKGLAWLLDGAANWLDRLPNCDLALVGCGPQRTDLERVVAMAHLTKRIHFLGFRSDVPAILARSELLVLPSRWEGMPNVVLEAMASGLAVVATDVEGVAELLGPNSPEQTVPQGQSDAWAKKVVELVGNRELANRLGRENRSRVVEHFHIDQMVESYASLWTGLVEQAK